MKVSIVVPVYQVERYIRQCVESILGQSYSNFELLLVDDGSIDASATICDEYAKLDSRVCAIHKKNGGLSDARNAGIRTATGEYTLFLDSDDYWDDNTALERLVERIRITKADVLNYCYKKVYETDGKVVNAFPEIDAMPNVECKQIQQLDYLFQRHLYICSACNKMVRTSILQSGVFFQVGETSEDVEWCAELLVRADSFDYFPLNFYCYRQRNGSITHSIKEKNCKDLLKHISYCAKLGKNANKEKKEYIFQLAAYQLAVFVATQSFCDVEPKECISCLTEYTWLLDYVGNTRKERLIALLSKLMGYQSVCKLVRTIRGIGRMR